MFDRQVLRRAGGMLVTGEIVFLVAGAFHPSHENANHHSAVFSEYAHSHDWGAVHLGQFVGLALFLAGIVLLVRALDARPGTTALLARAATISAVVAIALYAVLQAVDGVALKQAVDAWAHAHGTNKTAAFASAQTMRWLEWGVRSYQQLVHGLTLVLVGSLIVATRRLPRWLGYLAAAAGLAVAAQGVVIGAQGFSSASGTVGLVALVLPLVWVVGVALAARRATPKAPVQPATRRLEEASA